MAVNSAQAWRRWFGLLFLAISFGLLVWGQTFLKDRLQGMGYLIYWSVCFLFTFLAIATALLDILLMRRQNRIDRREVLKKVFIDSSSPAVGNSEEADNQNRST